MAPKSESRAGLFLFVGGAQFIIGVIIAEAVHPGYSVSGNVLSDLGLEPYGIIFNSSVFLFGLFALLSAYDIKRAFNNRLLSLLVGLAGIGAMLVGIFPEATYGQIGDAIHGLGALTAFLFGGLSGIAAHKMVRRPFTYFSLIMGVIALLALILYTGGIRFFIGRGGMQRMIAYPVVIWAIGFGAYVLGGSSRHSDSTESSS